MSDGGGRDAWRKARRHEGTEARRARTRPRAGMTRAEAEPSRTGTTSESRRSWRLGEKPVRGSVRVGWLGLAALGALCALGGEIRIGRCNHRAHRAHRAGARPCGHDIGILAFLVPWCEDGSGAEGTEARRARKRPKRNDARKDAESAEPESGRSGIIFAYLGALARDLIADRSGRLARTGCPLRPLCSRW